MHLNAIKVAYDKIQNHITCHNTVVKPAHESNKNIIIVQLLSTGIITRRGHFVDYLTISKTH